MAKRDVGEINAGSMADIAFLLLIFFLVTTTMDVDSGLPRQLPPPQTDEQPVNQDINVRNVFVVLVNRNNQLLVNGEPMQVEQLREKTKEFISNPLNKENLSENFTLSSKIGSETNTEQADAWNEAFRVLGKDVRVSKGVVSLQNDRATEYGVYMSVQNELVAAYNELRNELSTSCFQIKYDDLNENKQKAIRIIYPLSISEAEPRNIGGKK